MEYIKTVLLCVLLYPVYVSGQVCTFTEIENEVERINNSILYKTYRVFDGAIGNYTLIESKGLLKQYSISFDTIYFDEEKKIRKIIFTSEYGSLIGGISYYNNLGEMIFSMEYDVDQGVSVSCKRYLKNGKTFLLTGKVVEEIIPKILSTNIYYKDGEIILPYTGEMPADYNFSLDEKYDINSLLISMDVLNDSIKLFNCAKVKFEFPSLFDTTLLNGWDINIRKGPSIKEQIIDTISQLGHPVIVLEKIIEDNSSSMETYPWYKIRYNKYYWEKPDRMGYIYGKYLDPVEKTIK